MSLNISSLKCLCSWVTMSVLTKSYNVSKRILCAPFISRVYSTTQDDFMRSKLPDIEIPKANLMEYVMRDFGKWHNRIALECGITGKKHTFEQLRKNSITVSKNLRKRFQLKKGDVVALYLPNDPDYPVCVFGALFGGLTVTTINPTYTVDELERHLKDSNAKLIFISNGQYATVKKAFEKLKRTIPVVIIKTTPSESISADTINFNDLLQDTNIDLPELIPFEDGDVAFLPYSSGTTGVPKGVMLSNDNLVSNLVIIKQPELQYARETTDSYQEVLPLVLPMYHIYGFTISTMCLLNIGTKIITLPKFTPDTFLRAVEKSKPTLLHLVPPLVLFLLTYPGVKVEFLERLRVLFCGAAPLGGLDEERFRNFIGKPIQILQGYGMTESSPLIYMTPQSTEGKYPGSFGHPVSNTLVKLVVPDDPTLKHLGPNEIGELLVKGPQIMKGYWNKPEETEASFSDGWYRTGDLVKYDQDQIFYICDRIKELIKVKGFQVAPAELEEVIRDYPGVAEAAVIGIPHDFHGESPRAYIIEQEGHKVDTKKLSEYVSLKVAPHKKLTGGIAIIDSIPKNPSGKILRRVLRTQYKEKGI